MEGTELVALGAVLLTGASASAAVTFEMIGPGDAISFVIDVLDVIPAAGDEFLYEVEGIGALTTRISRPGK